MRDRCVINTRDPTWPQARFPDACDGGYTRSSGIQRETGQGNPKRRRRQERNERRARPLDEMDGQEAQRFLTDLYSRLNSEEEYDLRHEDYVMEMPQSGSASGAGIGCGSSRNLTPVMRPRRLVSVCAACW